MEYMEEVLSLDLEDSDYLYRIRRGHQIVYVSIQHPDILPTADRTDSSRILARLRNLPAWNDQWNTLTVTKTALGISSQADIFQPHRLSQLPVRPSEYYNFLDLPRVRRISDRISFVRLHMDVCVLKIARFGHELPALHTEIKAYGILERYGFRHAPKFLGYVYEETKDRVTGFLMEALSGHHPNIKDLEICQDAMTKLHALGIVHRDLNKFNIVIQEKTAKLIDFEAATFRDSEEYLKLEQEEASSLAQKLADTSMVGDRGI
jgi:hypothetical protein